MKVTKYIHSCLLVEDKDLHILIDPGNYSFEEGALIPSALPSLNYLFVTHEHADHMFIPGIKKLIAEFPGLKIITNPTAASILKGEGIEVSLELPDFVKIKEVPHEKIFMGPSPDNFQFDLFNKLTHPGDSHSMTETLEVLALPVQAPWGSTTTAVEKALELKPKIILPIHDWHWNDKAREGLYQRLQEFFAKQGIKFIPLKTGEQVEL